MQIYAGSGPVQNKGQSTLSTCLKEREQFEGEGERVYICVQVVSMRWGASTDMLNTFLDKATA